MRMLAAAAPMSDIGWLMVVKPGQTMPAVAMSSKPTTERSLGITSPRAWAVASTPRAISSLQAKIAVGGSAMDSSFSAASSPDL